MKNVFFLLFLICTAQSIAQQPVIVREYRKKITTYPFSDPDPVPKPDSKIYPYYRFDGFTDQPVQKDWNVVELENDYIKIMILPEIGGKIWSATEKSTGKEFIYNNHVVKFRDIAMRGPWTSGGIEANYGIIGHTPNCATPTDYTVIRKQDGSVSCIIGALDLLSETSWRLDINLPVDKAYFTTSSFWHNPTSFEQPYYTWMNTGLKASGNLEFIFNGKNYLGHDGEYNHWPINKKNGKDLRWYDRNNFGGYKSYHVFGKYSDFFGAYWHDDEFGMARYASHDDKPGKKIWIWGLSQQGMIWEKLLTDTNGQYVEVQSGRLFNQSAEASMYTPFNHRSFAPFQSDSWVEYWFPVKATHGFVKANNYGALNVKNENGWLKIYFCPLQSIKDKLEIFSQEKQIYSRSISVKPLLLFTDSVKIPVNSNKIKITLGENKFVWSSAADEADLNRPLKRPEKFNDNSVYGLYLQGKNLISFRDYAKAESKLKTCLEKDSFFLPALVDLSGLQMRKFQFKEALENTSKALSINTYDPAANYYYGLANKILGNINDAKDGFDLAAAGISYRSASYTELAKIYFSSGENDKAYAYAEKSLLTNQENVEGLKLLALFYRKNSDATNANRILEKIKQIDPLNHFVNFERYCLDGLLSSKERFISSIKNEMPEQTFLDLGIWYYSVNCNSDALKVFSLAKSNSEINLWKLYLGKSAFDSVGIQIAQTFPFRYETAQILSKLMIDHKNWQLKYQLALIEWHHGNIPKARKLLEECGRMPKDPNFYAVRASLMKHISKSVVDDLNTAISLNKNQWRYPKMLAEHYLHEKKYRPALNIAESFYLMHPENYIMGMLYAKTLILNQQYTRADNLLAELKILPFEGAVDGRKLYHEVKIMLALTEMNKNRFNEALLFIDEAKLWPVNLGAGRPYDAENDQRLEDWLEYQCYKNLGKKELATKSLKNIIQFVPKSDNTVLNFSPANHLITAWAIQKNNSKDAAVNWLKSQIKLFPDNNIIRWCLAEFIKSHSVKLTDDLKDSDVRVIEQLNKSMLKP